MEPVAGEIGHCFVVGARHQLRASMSAGWRGSAGQVRRNFRQWSPHRTTGFFFAGKNSNLGAGSDAGQVRRNFRQWSTGQLENFFAEVVGLDDNLDIFLAGKNSNLGAGLAGLRRRAGGAAREAMPGRLCRAGAARPPYDRMIRMIRMTRRAGVSGAPGHRHKPFFGCCPRGVPRGVQTQPAKNMFIRHVLRHVEIKRV